MALCNGQLVSFSTVYDALAAEQELKRQVDDGERDQGLLVWKAHDSLVVPRSWRSKGNIAEATIKCAKEGWPVFFRQTGGGVTPQGPGTINVSLAMRVEQAEVMSVSQSYDLICGPLIEFLGEYGLKGHCSAIPGSFCDGRYNVAIDHAKLAGTAQRWSGLSSRTGSRTLFAHALILVSSDLDEAISAVNSFMEILEEDTEIKRDSHVNLCDFVPQFSDPLSEINLTEQLHEKYMAKINEFPVLQRV